MAVYHCIFLLVASQLSCSTDNNITDDQKNVHNTFASEGVSITTARCVKTSFVAQIITNGKLTNGHELNISFPIEGVVEQVLISNGSNVRQGQLIASLKNDRETLALRQAKTQLDLSKIEINDLLITQGGRRDDSLSVNKGVYSYIKLRSGFQKASTDFEYALLSLRNTYLYAPISGTVANLSISEFSQISAVSPFCTILNRGQALVKCSILETELPTITIGQTAKIEPTAMPGKIYTGKVINVNPIVSPQGLINITISVLQPDGNLFSGMNTRVVIEKIFTNKLIVPKTAVLDRNDKKVVFTYNNGFSKWNYVTIGQQNDQQIIITSGLTAGEEVIVSGHMNLGHNAKVLKEKKDFLGK